MRWVTFFPNAKREHLTKDVGLLPVYMGKNGFNSQLVTTGTELKDAQIPEEVSGLEIDILSKKGKFFFLEKSFLNFLHQNSNQIDVLNLFHLNRDTIFYGLLYKRKNPKGFLYIKLDAYNQHLKIRKIFSKNSIKDFFLKSRARQFYNKVDLFTVENTKGKEIAEQTYPEWKTKIEYLPNGCNDLYLRNLSLNGSDKENIILSVGRLGSRDKNYDLLLKTLPLIQIEGWKFRIVGPISEEFYQKISSFFTRFPEMRAKVEFVGAILDRDELYSEYSKSRIFFLPSRFESFGIAYVEALYFGNVILGHEGMAAFSDLSSAGKFGVFYKDNDPESLAKCLEQAIDKADEQGIQTEIKEHTRANFYWSNLARRLSSRIQYE